MNEEKMGGFSLMAREEQWNKIIENIEHSLRLLEEQLVTAKKAKELDMARQLQREQYLER